MKNVLLTSVFLVTIFSLQILLDGKKKQSQVSGKVVKEKGIKSTDPSNIQLELNGKPLQISANQILLTLRLGTAADSNMRTAKLDSMDSVLLGLTKQSNKIASRWSILSEKNN